MSKGCAVLTVLADDTPLGVAHIARNALAASGAADLSGFLFDLLFPEHNDMANWVFRILK
ncbi:hypothetical protein [Tateyamaria sp.]|uniref:hypothetical protein n=1 Tax=Tateyamaria sp. TaxID=1929288 RepID=UPI00329D3A05